MIVACLWGSALWKRESCRSVVVSTAQCSRDLSVTLLYRASVKSVMQHTVAALADISMTKTIPTYPRLGCLYIKRTFRLKKRIYTFWIIIHKTKQYIRYQTMVFISYVPSAQEASRLVRKQKKNLMTAKVELFLVFIKYQNGVIFLNHSTESNKTETVIP